MLDLPGICSTLLCGREGVGMIAGDGVHNALLRIFNLLWGWPEERVRWRRWQGLMSLRCCVVTSGGASPYSCFLLLDRAGGGGLSAKATSAWRGGGPACR